MQRASFAVVGLGVLVLALRANAQACPDALPPHMRSAEKPGYLEIVNATRLPDFGMAAISLGEERRFLTVVRQGDASGFLEVPSGTHGLVLCKAAARSNNARACDPSGSVHDSAYAVAPCEYGRLVFVGGVVSEGNVTIEAFDLGNGPRESGIAAFVDGTMPRLDAPKTAARGPAMELCYRVKNGWLPALAQRRSDDDEFGGLLEPWRRALWSSGRVTVAVRRVGRRPCAGKLWGAAVIDKRRSEPWVLVAVGPHDGPATGRALVACPPMGPRKCVRIPVRVE